MHRKINVFIIGVQRAGTTSIYDWLGQHPEVDAPKELKDYHFFNIEEYYRKGFDFIHNFYNRKSKIRVFSAVNYIYFDKITAKQLFEYNSNAKLIICLRNPIDRAISAYKYFSRNYKEIDTFSKVLDKEIKGELTTFQDLANRTYISHGYYSSQIKTFLEYFPREQIKFVFFEELIDKSKHQQLRKEICDFINVSSDFEINLKHLNASGLPKSKFINLIKYKTFLPKFFGVFFPFKLRKRISKMIDELNISSEKENIEITPQDKHLLYQTLEDQIIQLYEITNSDIVESWIKIRN